MPVLFAYSSRKRPLCAYLGASAVVEEPAGNRLRSRRGQGFIGKWVLAPAPTCRRGDRQNSDCSVRHRSAGKAPGAGHPACIPSIAVPGGAGLKVKA